MHLEGEKERQCVIIIECTHIYTVVRYSDGEANAGEPSHIAYFYLLGYLSRFIIFHCREEARVSNVLCALPKYTWSLDLWTYLHIYNELHKRNEYFKPYRIIFA